MAVSICVVGAGVIGLSTALQILQNNPHYHVTIVAEKFASKTTSDAAGAIMEPFGLESTPIDLQK